MSLMLISGLSDGHVHTLFIGGDLLDACTDDSWNSFINECFLYHEHCKQLLNYKVNFKVAEMYMCDILAYYRQLASDANRLGKAS